MKRWTRIVFSLLLTLTTLGLSARLSLAQTATPVTTTPLTLNQTVSGTMQQGEKVIYPFDVPADQDVVLTLNADHVVMASICPLGATSANPCRSGGGGSDMPTDWTRLLTPTGIVQHLQVELTRPLEATTRYTLTAYATTPKPLDYGETGEIEPTADSPVQVYELDASTTYPFTVELEEERADGDFLWVAYQPWLYESVNPTSDGLPPVGPVDYAEAGSDESPLRFMRLNYAGRQKFHLAVGAAGKHTFYVSSVMPMQLDPQKRVQLSVSYRIPISAARLQTLRNDVALIELEVIRGSGAFASIYTIGNPRGTYQALGVTPNSTLTTALSTTVRHAAETNLGSYLVLQIPAQFTRDAADVAVRWELER